jgi:hypothetical protein
MDITEMKHGRLIGVRKDDNEYNFTNCKKSCLECKNLTLKANDDDIFSLQHYTCKGSRVMGLVVLYDSVYNFLKEWYPNYYEYIGELDNDKVQAALEIIDSGTDDSAPYDDGEFGNVTKLDNGDIVVDMEITDEENVSSLPNIGFCFDAHRPVGYTEAGVMYNKYPDMAVYVHYESLYVPFVFRETVCEGKVIWKCIGFDE